MVDKGLICMVHVIYIMHVIYIIHEMIEFHCLKHTCNVNDANKLEVFAIICLNFSYRNNAATAILDNGNDVTVEAVFIG